jgi:integrase
MAGANWIRDWPGGRVRLARGREVWVIERSFAGRRYAISLDVHAEADALVELALFERDPAGYRTKRQVAVADGAAPVRLDEAAVTVFLEYLAQRGRTRKYRMDCRYSLAEWAGALAGRDLRSVSGRELRGMLSDLGSRKNRIAHLKSFCAWLRDRDEGPVLTMQNDPSLALKVPVSRPEKARREKGYSIPLIEALYRVLWRQDVRDVLRLRACTGMHHTEIERLAAGAGALRRVDDPSGIAGTIRFVHKSGNEHILSLDPEAFAAAERLATGKVPRDHTVARTLDRAARRINPENPPTLNASELRHSFATWAEEVGQVIYPKGRGAPGELISAVMGHTAATTRALFYRGVRVPPMIKIPIQLEHPNDPSEG